MNSATSSLNWMWPSRTLMAISHAEAALKKTSSPVSQDGLDPLREPGIVGDPPEEGVRVEEVTVNNLPWPLHW